MNEILENYVNKLGDTKNQSVTWEGLLRCLADFADKYIQTMDHGDKAIYSVVEELFKEAEYRRIRSMSFVMAAMGYADSKDWINAYQEYCEKFDEGNRDKLMEEEKETENEH